jgi:hypothetical protein
MLYVDIPTLPEFKALATVRGDGCVSIYLPTTPLPQETSVSRAQLKTFGKAALDQLDEAGLENRRQGRAEGTAASVFAAHRCGTSPGSRGS